MTPVPRLKPYQGLAFFSYGFRPFFFLGACEAALAIGLWLPLFEGHLALWTLFAARDWHVHEMLFGYVPAIVTGFLLTAIPNWTGRLPLLGPPLAVLVTVWVAGRVAILTLAVMTRASLGHTGNELVAGPGTQLIYAAVVVAALARVLASLSPAWALVLIHVAALAWVAAFGDFAMLYGPLLFRARQR